MHVSYIRQYVPWRLAVIKFVTRSRCCGNIVMILIRKINVRIEGRAEMNANFESLEPIESGNFLVRSV